MSPLHISNSTQNNTNCRKLVIIHITKRHSFIVLYSLHSLYPSVYAYMNMRITMVMLLRHTGHVSITATRFAQLSQKRACPQGTSANPSRGATKLLTQYFPPLGKLTSKCQEWVNRATTRLAVAIGSEDRRSSQR